MPEGFAEVPPNPAPPDAVPPDVAVLPDEELQAVSISTAVAAHKPATSPVSRWRARSLEPDPVLRTDRGSPSRVIIVVPLRR
jgi:hypothetical protein